MLDLVVVSARAVATDVVSLELADPKEHAANDYMMICVSRALTPRLVLDL